MIKRICGVIAGLVLAWNVQAAPLLLDGALTNAGASYSIADLQGFGGSTTQTVVIKGVPVTYTGVPLWTLLGDGANVITSGGGNNPVLRNYIIASGDAGARSIVSLGEINPGFGGTGPSYLVAYERDGVTLSTPELVVPQDGTGTRNVTEFTTLTISSVPLASGPGGISPQFTVSDDGALLGTVDKAVIAGYPAVSEIVTFLSGGSSQTATFTGVPLWDLLLGTGVDDEDLTERYLVAYGSDGYTVTFSLAEFNPDFGAPNTLLAYGDSRVPDGSLGTAGEFRLVIPGDLRGGRFVSNLVGLEVIRLAVPVPEPGSVLLIMSGLVVWAMFGWRNRASRGNEASGSGAAT